MTNHREPNRASLTHAQITHSATSALGSNPSASSNSRYASSPASELTPGFNPRAIAYGKSLYAVRYCEQNASNARHHRSCFDSSLFSIRFHGSAWPTTCQAGPSRGCDSRIPICNSPGFNPGASHEIAASSGGQNPASEPRRAIHLPGTPWPPRLIQHKALGPIAESLRTRCNSVRHPGNAGLSGCGCPSKS